MNRELKRYLRQVRSWLPCTKKVKKKITTDIASSISSYLEENPSANFEDIQRRFGTPHQIASAHVDEMGAVELLQNLRVRRRVVRITTIGVAAVLTLWTIAVSYAMIDSHISSAGYHVIQIIES